MWFTSLEFSTVYIPHAQFLWDSLYLQFLPADHFLRICPTKIPRHVHFCIGPVSSQPYTSLFDHCNSGKRTLKLMKKPFIYCLFPSHVICQVHLTSFKDLLSHSGIHIGKHPKKFILYIGSEKTHRILWDILSNLCFIFHKVLFLHNFIFFYSSNLFFINKA